MIDVRVQYPWAVVVAGCEKPTFAGASLFAMATMTSARAMVPAAHFRILFTPISAEDQTSATPLPLCHND